MDYVIYNNDQNHTYLALQHGFFLVFKVHNLAFCFYFPLFVYSQMDILVIQIWEML